MAPQWGKGTHWALPGWGKAAGGEPSLWLTSIPGGLLLKFVSCLHYKTNIEDSGLEAGRNGSCLLKATLHPGFARAPEGRGWTAGLRQGSTCRGRVAEGRQCFLQGPSALTTSAFMTFNPTHF